MRYNDKSGQVDIKRIYATRTTLIMLKSRPKMLYGISKIFIYYALHVSPLLCSNMNNIAMEIPLCGLSNRVFSKHTLFSIIQHTLNFLLEHILLCII